VTPPPPEPLYKGEPLDAARGPGLGCFWIQVAVLAVLLVVTPLSVIASAPTWLSAVLLVITLLLLLFAGQTVIFLLRLVAADRRTRRRPMAATARRTVGDLEEGVAGDLTWSAMQLAPALEPIYEAAAAEARARLQSAAEVAPFTVIEDASGTPHIIDGDAAADTSELGSASTVATVTDARLRLPGLRRPTEAIRIDLGSRDGPASTVAIRYESEGPPRYRYWPPVMADGGQARSPAMADPDVRDDVDHA